MSEFTSAYALARHVAHQLPQHSGKSARELYQAFLPEFSAFGTDGSTGATMINQHLRRMEEEGLVISEKGKMRGNPSKWHWAGPPDASPESAPESTEPNAERDPDPSSEPKGPREPRPMSEPWHAREPVGRSESRPKTEPKWQSEPVSAREPISLSEPKSLREPNSQSEPLPTSEPDEPSDPREDHWDLLARQFAAACREQAAADLSIGGIDGLDTKLFVIERLKTITSTEIADVLDAIGDDLIKIRGISS